MMLKQLTLNNKRLTFALSLIAIILAIVPLIANIQRASLGLINAHDFGIYQKALLEIAHSPYWNPYVTVINMPIMNDHFDPAVYIGALFTKIFDFRLYGFLIFEWCWFIGALIFLLITSKDKKQIFSSMFLFLFSRGILEGIEFPIHPTTWSMLPAMLFVFFIHNKNYQKAFIAALVLSTFREIYFFMFAGVAAYFLLNKNWKQGIAYSLLSASLIFTLLFLRPLLLGETAQYSHQATSLSIPQLLNQFLIFKYPWKVFLPFIALIVIYLYKEISKIRTSSITMTILFILPGILIHILSGRMVHHHAIPFIAPLVASVHLNYILPNLSKKILLLIMATFIFTASSRYTRAIKSIVIPNSHLKVDTDEKKESIQRLKPYLKELNGKTVIATGGILPFIQTPNESFFHYSHLAPKDITYDYVLIEKKRGDIFPLNETQSARAITCLKEDFESDFEDEFFILIQNSKKSDCLMLKEFFPTIVIPVGK